MYGRPRACSRQDKRVQNSVDEQEPQEKYKEIFSIPLKWLSMGFAGVSLILSLISDSPVWAFFLGMAVVSFAVVVTLDKW